MNAQGIHAADKAPPPTQLSYERRRQLQRLRRDSGVAATSTSIPAEATSFHANVVMEDASAKVSADEQSVDAISADKAADPVSTGFRISSTSNTSDPVISVDKTTIPITVSTTSSDKGKSVMTEQTLPARPKSKKELEKERLS